MNPHKTSDKSAKENELFSLVEKKKIFFNDVIQKTIININRNKLLDILAISDLNACVNNLHIINDKIKELSNITKVVPLNTDLLVNSLQTINNDLSSLLKNYGTDSLDDLLVICFGNNNFIINTDEEILKYDLLKKYFHPTGYKVIKKSEKPEKSEKSEKNEKSENNKPMTLHIEEDDEAFENLGCTDISLISKPFHLKVYGMKIVIYNSNLKKNLMVYGIVDETIIHFLESPFINKKMKMIKEHLPKEAEFNNDTFSRYLISLSLKDLLIYNHPELYSKYIGYLSQHKLFKQKNLSQIVKEFMSSDLFGKRSVIVQLLINSDNYDSKYMAYLLYDLLSNESNGTIDTNEQTVLFDSFPWPIKQYFRDAMKKTIQYTNNLANFDMNKIPLEQQICLMKTTDVIKEKAMIKLKEVKSKAEDSGSKARQYLEGLLKIPFNIYKKEPILCIMSQVREMFKAIYKKYNIETVFPDIPNKGKYTNMEIVHYIKKIESSASFSEIDNIKKYLVAGDKNKLLQNIQDVNDLLAKHKKADLSLKYANKMKKDLLKKVLEKYVDVCKTDSALLTITQEHFTPLIASSDAKQSNKLTEKDTDISALKENIGKITTYMEYVKSTLDKTVYGHTKAKRHIERIIAQWVNNDTSGNNDGYVIGLEGNPGVGKTTLAKGLAECLKDEDGNTRPIAFIAMGGSSNASTLIGHSYTYVGSSWGEIVQILIDKKCMNPIILIDEVDKISKTENGKEITGILTHLLDPTQNAGFQDKYFAGIDLDLSKVLFVLSYNDAESIDRILLDRIHRIKFDSLLLDDKLVIARKHLLPDMYAKVGLDGMIQFSDDCLKYIIEEYTMEPGVRKLKEKLFEIVGEINLDILQRDTGTATFPIEVTVEDIKTKYFKDKREVRLQKIHPESMVGVINCLWANSYNVGGILSATVKFVPSDKYLDFRMTGLLDKMMEESFQLSLTNAYSLLSEERKSELNELYNGSKQKYGIHLHMGDGSINKSGTSAGIAISVLLYSLLTNKKIKHDYAITGEAKDLLGNVSEIGGVHIKFTYGIKSGVKNFIFPTENEKDFKEFMEKNKDKDLIKGINFYPVSHVTEALKLILED